MTDNTNTHKFFLDHIKDDFQNLSAQEMRITLRRLEGITKMKSRSESRDKETHRSYSLICAAYLHMLETNNTAKECLQHVAKEHMKDIETVLSEKSNPIGKMSRSVVNTHTHHEIQKDMVKRNKFNKQALVNSKNVWQLLNTLSSFRQAYQELIDMELEIAMLKQENRQIQLDLANAKSDIRQLQDITGVKELSPKDKAKYLDELGYTKQDIAEVVGKDVRTIRRWLN